MSGHSSSQHQGCTKNIKDDSSERKSGEQSVRVDKKHRKIIDVDAADITNTFAQSLDGGFRNASLNKGSKNKVAITS